jgi:CarD family transcriptional regulator
MKTPAAAVAAAKTVPVPPAPAEPGRRAGKARIATAAPKEAKPPARKPAAVTPPSNPKPPVRPAKPAAQPIEVKALQSNAAPAVKAEPIIEAAPAPAPAAAAVPPPASPLPARPSIPQGPNGRPAPISRASNKDETFSAGDYVVYPTHGVGRVEKIASEDIAGHTLQLIHITFEENRMTLRVPVAKARSAGLRRLSTRKMFDEALAVLKGRARIKRTMWSRRAQEYEAKINSGDPVAIAEVVRDLHRNAGQPDQSFSERQIYEAAMDRLAAELGALDLTDKTAAMTKLAGMLKPV